MQVSSSKKYTFMGTRFVKFQSIFTMMPIRSEKVRDLVEFFASLHGCSIKKYFNKKPFSNEKGFLDENYFISTPVATVSTGVFICAPVSPIGRTRISPRFPPRFIIPPCLKFPFPIPYPIGPR